MRNDTLGRRRRRQLANGSLLLNMRRYKGCIYDTNASSNKGGLAVPFACSGPTLVEPACEGALIRYTLAGQRAGTAEKFVKKSTNYTSRSIG